MTLEAFAKSFGTIQTLRAVAKRFGRDIHCSRDLVNAEPFRGVADEPGNWSIFS